jgi:hypothetical protein
MSLLWVLKSTEIAVKPRELFPKKHEKHCCCKDQRLMGTWESGDPRPLSAIIKALTGLPVLHETKKENVDLVTSDVRYRKCKRKTHHNGSLEAWFRMLLQPCASKVDLLVRKPLIFSKCTEIKPADIWNQIPQFTKLDANGNPWITWNPRLAKLRLTRDCSV